MAPRPQIPPELKRRPFTLAEARAAGITSTSLRGKSWRRVDRGIYAWAELVHDAVETMRALQQLLRGAVYAGRTAAWLYGIGGDPGDPIEVIVPAQSGLRSRRGLAIHRTDLLPKDVRVVRGLRATSPLRTLADLSPRMAGVDALGLIDAAIRLRLTSKIELSTSRSTALRVLGPLAEPAESPMETHLRWLLIKAGLPRPSVQANLFDALGRFVGRADLYYPDARLVIEFDGGHHRNQLTEDNRRQNMLIQAGYTVLRFTASDIYSRPETIVSQVSGAAAACARRQGAARR